MASNTSTSDERAASRTDDRDGVVVVGGGYAGLHAARAVADAGIAVTVVDPDSSHHHITRLAAVAGGTVAPSRARTPFGDFGHDTIVGTVETVHDGRIGLADGRTIEADAVVVSAGARPTRPPIEGLEQAMPLRTADDALALRDRIDVADRLIVIGGGATGVQLAGCASAAHPDLEIVVLEAGPRLLAPMSSETADGAQRILERRGVAVHLDTSVEKIDEDGVLIEGELVQGVPVWAGGFEARADELGVQVSKDGRIVVDDRLRILGMERTFAAGDVAAHLDGDGSSLPLSAQIAVQAGTAAGRNAAAVVRGAEPTRPTLEQRGWVLDLGGRRGLAEFGPIRLTGSFVDLLPPLLHDAIDVKTVVGGRGLGALPSALVGLVQELTASSSR